MKTMRSLIIEDNPHSREELKYLLKPYSKIEIVGEAENGIHGLELTRELKPDVVFLDINMPGINGIEYADIVQTDKSDPPMIIFVTAFAEHAQACYEYRPVHYLLKPIDECQLTKAIKWAQEEIEEISNDSNKINFRSRQSKKVYLDIDKVIYISCKNNITYVHTEESSHESRTPLKEFLLRLNKHNFQQIHRSYIFNRNYSGDFFYLPPGDESGGRLVVKNCKEILPVGRSFCKNWMDE